MTMYWILIKSYFNFIILQNFEPVPYPKSDYGKFYTGDSYIVLNVSHEALIIAHSKIENHLISMVTWVHAG